MYPLNEPAILEGGSGGPDFPRILVRNVKLYPTGILSATRNVTRNKTVESDVHQRSSTGGELLHIPDQLQAYIYRETCARFALVG